MTEEKTQKRRLAVDIDVKLMSFAEGADLSKSSLRKLASEGANEHLREHLASYINFCVNEVASENLTFVVLQVLSKSEKGRATSGEITGSAISTGAFDSTAPHFLHLDVEEELNDLHVMGLVRISRNKEAVITESGIEVLRLVTERKEAIETLRRETPKLVKISRKL